MNEVSRTSHDMWKTSAATIVGAGLAVVLTSAFHRDSILDPMLVLAAAPWRAR